MCVKKFNRLLIYLLYFAVLLFLFNLLRVMVNDDIQPPIAKKDQSISKNFNDEKIDFYSWLRDENYPKVNNNEILDYLKFENNYSKYELSRYSDLIDKIYNEVKDRINEEDETVPIKIDDYYYYSYISKDMDYWVHSRKYKSLENKEEILIDENKLAQDHDYCNVKGIKISPDHKLIAYAVDYKGNEEYEIKVKNIKQDKLLNDYIPNTFGELVWHENNKGFFYIPTGENWRAKKVLFHKLGTSYEKDILVYEEKDITFSVNIYKSNSKKYLIIVSGNNEENEDYFINLSKNNLEPKLFYKRKSGHKYFINDHNNKFFIITNDKGKNFRIAEIDKDNMNKPWKDFVAYSKSRYIRNFELYNQNMVITSSNNHNGLLDIEIINLENGFSKKLAFPNQSYHVDVIFTTYDADGFRFNYSSLSTPLTIKEYNFKSGKEKILKVDKIPSGFDLNNYKVKRLYAKARDGKKVPISLIYKKDKFKLGSDNPLYLYGYGSYGISIPQTFRKNIFSLVDRGFVYAIAHVRGGDDLGYEWYESAKFLNKKNTFYDFIDSAKYLITNKYVKKGNITIMGGSAGGILVGFCANEEPELFNTVVAHVPFVDVLNTMLDESLPLTPGEFKEWGNPKEKEYYDYIKSYSPYDNVKKQNYPHFFITAGLSDPRVTYWEPAKWVAKLREYKTDKNKILFKINMDAGHAGKTGRYTHLKEIAEEYAFVIEKAK
ncbi:S9 family peptidase [Rickettsiales endosymbiont of Trichoplax sp. H2]|uniref:S9 family peptidase n=1 Tax=Rickettsiales endosymbiont of Trichoplax sp. H2 TaxID=2021221 RepID=UPI0012B3548D|nr:S9 family peptidase [Rickettsiales endosymbiont of Trichoplax sp. H2]MSO13366.1 Protease 2 [Rickettsiales endosymbiont of Trichoplax sp. H2]